MTNFTYGEINSSTGSDEFVVIVPPLETQGGVIDWYAENLSFPNYFGYNWDAFEECLKDLSWIKASHIRIYHVDLPLERYPEEQRIYVSIISNVVDDWRDDSSRTVSIIFPPRVQHKVERILELLRHDT